MAVFLDKLNRNFELLPEKLQPWRWWILGLYILLMLFLASGIPRFSFTWAIDCVIFCQDLCKIILFHLLLSNIVGR